MSKARLKLLLGLSQHRPRRQWADLFADLASNLSYVETAVAIHQSDLAVVATVNNVPSGQNIANAMKAYADAHHPVVCFTPIKMLFD